MENGNGAKANFAIKDCPLGVWRGISEPAKTHCNDIYWVRLKELLDKERELETLRTAVFNGLIYSDKKLEEPVVEEQPPVEVVKEEPKRKYLGSARREENAEN